VGSKEREREVEVGSLCLSNPSIHDLRSASDRPEVIHINTVNSNRRLIGIRFPSLFVTDDVRSDLDLFPDFCFCSVARGAQPITSHAVQLETMNQHIRSRLATTVAQQVDAHGFTLSLGSQRQTRTRPNQLNMAREHFSETRSDHGVNIRPSHSRPEAENVPTKTLGSRDRRKRFPPSSASSWLTVNHDRLAGVDKSLHRFAHTATVAIMAHETHDDPLEDMAHFVERTDRRDIIPPRAHEQRELGQFRRLEEPR
jgi:hypothetical protein